MGTWGVALFADDVACDVRDAWRDHVAQGLEGPAATKKLLKEWAGTLKDDEEGAVAWLALAATQWELGRLEPQVKAKALQVIKSGADLGRWAEDGSLTKQRVAVLKRLAKKLRSPPPQPKKLRPPAPPPPNPFNPGDLFAFALKPKKLILLHVAEMLGQNAPTFRVLDWIGREPPPPARLRRLAKAKSPIWRLRCGHTAYEKNPKKIPWDRLAKVEVPLPAPAAGFFASFNDWAGFEKLMLEVFELVKTPPAVRLSHELGLLGHHVAVWAPRGPETVEGAHALFAGYATKDWRRPRDLPKLRVTPALVAFVAEAKAAFPPEARPQTWLGDFAAKEGCVCIGILDRALPKVLPFLRKAASRHGLVCYDPQKRRLDLP